MLLNYKFITNAKKTLILPIVITLLAACTTEIETELLPMLPFPLSESEIAQALQESGLSWTIEPIPEEERPRIGGDVLESHFTIYKDAATVGWISNWDVAGESRNLQILFSGRASGFHEGIYTPSKEYAGSLMAFASLLYGGFESTYQVFDYFNSEIAAAERHPVELFPDMPNIPPAFEDRVIWTKIIDGVLVRVLMVRPLGSDVDYFLNIYIVDDPDWFENIAAQFE